MFKASNEISPQSRVWIYQSNRPFSANEEKEVNDKLHAFVSDWQSHGAPVIGSYEIIEHQFIVLMADDQCDVGGCSIDSSVGIIRELEGKFKLGLLDNTSVCLKENDNIISLPFNQIKPAISEGKISKNSVVYNNTITRKEELTTDWQQKAENSWLSRYF